MKRIVLDRWLDLGELGQHEAVIVGSMGAYGSFDLLDSITVSKKNTTIELIDFIDTETRDMLLDELKAKYLDMLG